MSHAVRCPSCGSEDLIVGAVLEDRDQAGVRNATVRVGFNHPDALVFKEPVLAEIRADICGSCGHVWLRVTDPAFLWRCYQRLPSTARGR